nr:MAG TPA: hypothetical protein [Caudoviricetes sp.]
MLRLIRTIRRHLRLNHWRTWWRHDVLFRRNFALLTRGLFSFDRRYWFLRALVRADQRRGNL